MSEAKRFGPARGPTEGISLWRGGKAGASHAPKIDRSTGTTAAPSGTERHGGDGSVVPPVVPFEVLVCGAEICKQGIVYGLVDPREPEVVRYVGQTVSAPLLRFADHLRPARTDLSRRAVWCRQLVSVGAPPDMVLIARVPVIRHLDYWERYWIRYYKALGQADLNASLPSVWDAVGAHALPAESVRRDAELEFRRSQVPPSLAGVRL